MSQQADTEARQQFDTIVNYSVLLLVDINKYGNLVYVNSNGITLSSDYDDIDTFKTMIYKEDYENVW